MSNFRRPKHWKKLRRAIGQSNHKRSKSRRFRGEGLENRVLLAADVAPQFHNVNDPVDVNHDGHHTLNDALHVISSLRQTGPRSLIIPLASAGAGEGEGGGGMSIDVNGDNNLSLSDALEVISTLRSEGEEPEFFTNTNEDTPITLTLDMIAPGAPEGSTISSVSNLSIDPENSPLDPGELINNVNSVTYEPPENYSGQATFEYSWLHIISTDPPNFETDSGTVTIDILEINDAPRALNDAPVTLEQGDEEIINVLDNDLIAPDDPSDESLSVTAINGVTITPTNRSVPITSGSSRVGTVTVNQDNTVTFAADNPLFFHVNGNTTSFLYTISDSGRDVNSDGDFDDPGDQAPLTSSATASVNIIPSETPVRYTFEAVDAVSGQPISEINQGDVFNLNIFAEDFRDPNEVCTYDAEETADQCSTGVVSFGIDLGFDPSMFEAVELSPGEPDVTFPPLFNQGVNPDPTTDTPGFIRNIAESLGIGTINSSGTLGPGPQLTATVALRAIGSGSATLDPVLPINDANVTSFFEPVLALFTPGDDPQFSNGIDKLDLVGDSLNIIAPIDALDDTFTVAEDSGTTLLDVTTQGTPDRVTAGGTISLDDVSEGSQGGTITVGSNDRVSYTPAANFNGTEEFTYTIIDGRGNSSTANVVVTVTPVNDPPVATNDSPNAVIEDSTDNPIDVLANDNIGVDEGETLEITGVSNFSDGGSATFVGGQQILYTPAADFAGTETFNYTIRDSNGGTATAQVTIEVTNVNDDPTANDDSATMDEDSSDNLIDVLDNDSILPDAGETLTITGVSNFSNGGSATFAGGQQILYTPAANVNGTETFDYTITDGTTTATATVTVTINSVNDAPVANDDLGFSVKVGDFIDLDLLDNDNDGVDDGETLSIESFSASQFGATLEIRDNGQTLRYTPSASSQFNVTDNFTYTITDNDATNPLTATANVSVQIQPASLPLAVSDTGTIEEDDGSIDIDVLANDEKNPTGTFNIKDFSNMSTVSTSDQGGTIEIVGSGEAAIIRYTPATDFSGTDQFTYQITDGIADGDGVNTSTGTVTITVTPVNDEPVANPDMATTDEDQSVTIDVIGNDLDVDGDDLDLDQVTQGANGSVTIEGNQAVYTPNADFNGNDSFTYTITDGNLTATATVTVTINSVNDEPVLTLAGNQTVAEDSGAASVADFVTEASAGADNESGQVLTLSVTDVSDASLFSDGPSIDQGTGELTYTPAADAFGTATITVTLADDGGVANGGIDTTTETFTITITSVNDPPTFAGVDGNDQEVNEDSGPQNVGGFATAIGAGAANESGQELTFNVSADDTSLFATQPAINPETGVLTYTPAADANGTATVTVTLSDNGGGNDTSLSQSFEIVINPVNDTPSFTLGADQTVQEDSGAASVTGFATSSAGPANESDQVVTFDVESDNTALFSTQPAISESGELTFTPAADAFGSADVTVFVTDNGGTDRGGVDTSGTQTFTITITSVNDAPVANDDSLTAIEADPVLSVTDNTTLLNPLANDTDVEDHDLEITSVGSSMLGATISISDNGTRISYLPPVDTFNVTDTFTYTIDDGNGGTDTATIDVFIEPLSLPRARNDFATVDEDSTDADAANTIDVLDNDRKNDAGTFTITDFSQPANGTVAFNATNDQLVYTPNADFQGMDTFTYMITDGVDDGDGVDTSTGTVTVTVNNLNDPPTANDDTATVQEDSTDNVIDALDNDEFAPDPEETLEITGASTNMGGTVDFTSGTEILYTPAADFFGEETITYTISDPSGATDTATIVVTVENVNDDPTAVDDMFTGIVEDSQLADNLLDVLANDQITPDVGETLTITTVGMTSDGGTVSIEGGTALRYQPAADFFGTETFTYTISDGTSTAVGNVSVVVNNTNDDPTANNDLFERILQTSSDNILDVLANDTIEPDAGETLTITGIAADSSTTATAGPITTDNGGTVSISGDGQSIIYTPSGTFEGNDTFTYEIADGNGGTATAEVTVEVINFLTGSFSGFVYDDQNSDDDHDPGERGYGGVEAHLTGFDFTGEAVNLTVETDASGKYEFLELVPGSYEIEIDQPGFTLPGTYDSDSGDATVTTDGQGQSSFEFEFDILDGTEAMQNNFRLAGFDPGEVNSVWDLLASSSGGQAIAIVNPTGSEGEFFTLRDGWEGMQSVSVELVDSDTVRLHVTDGGGSMHSYDIPAIRETADGPYFRILAEDEASGMVAIRVIATPEDFGL